jgi:ribosomal protein S18 acetylase RimI-like enzyme
MWIRQATPADAALLAELGAQTFRESFGHLYGAADLRQFLEAERSTAAFAQRLSDPQTRTLLALETDAADAKTRVAIGYTVFGRCKLPVPDLEREAGELQQLYVLQAWQGGGRGRSLLEAALGELVTVQRHAPLYVGVWSQNPGAQRLYARYGFQKVGEYDFPVGAQLDREFILKRSAGDRPVGQHEPGTAPGARTTGATAR